MAFNGDTDGPHNKRLCTGQNNSSGINDNNNNTTSNSNNINNSSNGSNNSDMDLKGGSRVNFFYKFLY